MFTLLKPRQRREKSAWVGVNESRPGHASPGVPRGEFIEALEGRRLLAAAPALTVENLDGLPGHERLIFNRINVRDTRVPNRVHDTATLRLRNTGGSTLLVNALRISGPWRVVGTAPRSIAPGGAANVTIQFTATSGPAFTYNQTNWTSNIRGGGAHIGSLSIATNDPRRPKVVEQLAGWWQSRSEANAEPNLQTIVNLISNYKTNINPTRTHWLPEPTGKRYYGEEVPSAYWRAADTTRQVGVRHLASFHSQGFPVRLAWHSRGSNTLRNLVVTAGNEGQSFLPHLQSNPAAPAAGRFTAGTGVFGFKIDNEWTDDRKNFQSGGGHHIRFYPVRTHLGAIIPNTYFMCMDYSVPGAGAGAQNFDFQDNVYIVTNVRPAGN